MKSFLFYNFKVYYSNTPVIRTKMSAKVNYELSIYIPRISVHMTEALVIKEFLSKDIGRVRRVDFVSIEKQKGFEEKLSPIWMSAFVHFDEIFENRITYEIKEALEKGENYKIVAYCSNEYWLICKANAPIQETLMNNHQIVENCRHLEKTVQQQSLTINKLEKDIDRLQKAVYHLLGGLYCHKTQQHELHNSLTDLFGVDDLPWKPDTDRDEHWCKYPTTRQGDNNECRLNDLEDRLDAIEKKTDINESIFGTNYSPIKINAEYDEICSFNSIPDLIPDSDSDEEQCLESANIMARIKISRELCDN